MIFRLLSKIFRFLVGFMRFAIDSWANSSIVFGESSLSFFPPAFPICTLGAFVSCEVSCRFDFPPVWLAIGPVKPFFC